MRRLPRRARRRPAPGRARRGRRRDREIADDAGERARDGELHLHRLEDEQHVALLDLRRRLARARRGRCRASAPRASRAAPPPGLRRRASVQRVGHAVVERQTAGRRGPRRRAYADPSPRAAAPLELGAHRRPPSNPPVPSERTAAWTSPRRRSAGRGPSPAHREPPAVARVPGVVRRRLAEQRDEGERPGAGVGRRRRERVRRAARSGRCRARPRAPRAVPAAPAGRRRSSPAPSTASAASARSSRAERRRAVRAVGDHLGEHRVVVRGRPPCPPRRRCRRASPPGWRRQATIRPLEGRKPLRRVLGVDARLDRVAVRAARPPGASGSGSPAATRSCSSTRSSPVTASVTGCSTCRRAFISRKKNSDGSSAAAMNSTVPASDVAAARASATAAAPIRARSSASTTGEGASSITFWWRRWRLHSRSPRWTQRAVRVGEHLHLDVARALEVALDEQPVVAEGRAGLAARRPERLGSSSGARTTRMPLPPPPATALTQHAAAPCAGPLDDLLVAEATRPRSPGTTGTPASAATCLARGLVAEQRHRLGRGADEGERRPRRQARANGGRSERKP